MAIGQFQEKQHFDKNAFCARIIKKGLSVIVLAAVLLLGFYLWNQMPKPVVRPEAGWSAILPEAKKWRLQYLDSFDANYGFWEYGNQSYPRWDGDFQIIDGKYRLDARSKGKGFSHVDIRNIERLADEFFYIAVDAKQPDGIEGNSGLVFRINRSKDDFKNFYAFTIEGDHFVFEKSTNEWERIIDWTPSSAINQGQFNRLAVVVIKSHFVLFINDQFVGEADDYQFTEGPVGISIALIKGGDNGVFEFDNFEYRVP